MSRLILNQGAFVWARELISSKQIMHEAIDWEKLRADDKSKKEFMKTSGALSYSLWFLGKDPEKDANDLSAYDLPLGDFSFIYTGALGAIKDYANDHQLYQIQLAASKLLEVAGMRDFSK
ncbi:MAG: hypothetical protein MI784_07900 [Cytophagales bacterium]|nr:hypothetical protein [Cytophagales bacterium]